ncbi:MAG: hypothetical protein H6807_09280 [Planctomycetes bacterium]|nr:hypothetical protein [Planctomycetota bacterium]
MSEKKSFLPEDVCPLLRTKSLYLNSNYRTTPFEERHQADVALFWCCVTMQPHGPDQADATAQTCRPGRDCWAGDPAV